MKMVELRQVSKRYGDVQALDQTDLTVRRGEFVTLLGPSGSGKTTLLNLIAGTIRPTTGQVWINGSDMTQSPPSQRGLGMVFQNYALMPHMTVFENIAFPLRVRGMGKQEIHDRVHDVLRLVRLPDVAQRRPRELSGGQQQRISLARCIVYNPSLILLDEPLGALDKKLREQMQLEIRQVHAELGITMLNVTHDQDEALTMSDRIVLMNQGRIEQEDTPEAMYFRPASVFAADFIGSANLVPAQVVQAGDGVVSLQSALGGIQAPAPDMALTPSGDVMVLLRPESLRLASAEAPGQRDAACVLQDTIVLGSTVRHHVVLPNGQALTVQEQNTCDRPRIARGASVSVSWHDKDCLILA